MQLVLTEKYFLGLMTSSKLLAISITLITAATKPKTVAYDQLINAMCQSAHWAVTLQQFIRDT